LRKKGEIIHSERLLTPEELVKSVGKKRGIGQFYEEFEGL